MSRAWAGGSNRRQRKIRQLVIDAAGGLCQLRIEAVCTTLATTAHHTLGKGVTGDDPLYQVAACEACNLHVGDPLAQGADPEPIQRTHW